MKHEEQSQKSETGMANEECRKGIVTNTSRNEKAWVQRVFLNSAF